MNIKLKIIVFLFIILINPINSFSNEEIFKAEKWLNKINSKVANKHSDILTNKGIISARQGNLQLAQKLFNQAGTSELNQAILDQLRNSIEGH